MPRNLALIIDRDEAVRALLAEVLHDEGWQTVTLSVMPQCQDVAGLSPTLIILELWQEQAANDLLARLGRSNDGSMPPIMLTSTNSELLEQLRDDNGQNYYPALLKPFRMEVLLHLLKRAVGSHQERVPCL